LLSFKIFPQNSFSRGKRITIKNKFCGKNRKFNKNENSEEVIILKHISNFQTYIGNAKGSAKQVQTQK